MRWIVCIWLATITALSLAPFEVKVQLGTMGRFHDLGHFSIFLLTAILLSWTGQGPKSKLVRCVGVCWIAAFLEALETAVYHNRFEWHDVIIDAFGAAIGFAVISMASLVPSGFHNSEVSPER